MVVNGVTKVFKRVITNADVKPFLKIFLPEKNVLGVTSVIQRDGSNIQALPQPTEFLSSNNKWYEVEALAQDKVFIEDTTKRSDQPGLKVGKWESVSRKFITEYTPQGFFYLTLGGGSNSAQNTLDDFSQNGITLNLDRYMNNLALGITPRTNTTLFIQYRVGGGTATNVGTNVINTFGTVDFVVNGPNTNINTQVTNSLSVNNVTAAVGGANQPSVEEIRNYIGFNFSSQQRAVTIRDYKSIIETMPSLFGAPAKVGVMEVENKIYINLLSFDDDGNLTNKISSTLLNNIAEYLSNYRMMNDYLVIEPAQVIDLSFEIDLLLDPSFNQGEVVTEVIQVVNQFLSPSNLELGQDIFLGILIRNVSNVNGVINLIDFRVYNKVGGDYSSNQVSQSYSDPQTKQIELIDGTIFAQPMQTFRIKFANKDIIVRAKNTNQTQIS